jgi:predicted DNA-binding antitoxin AbrB/MazE fold protein
MQTLRAIYEAGVLRPLKKLRLREHQPVLITVFPSEDDDIPTQAIAKAALKGHSFDFLADPAEDLYQPTDGEPV